MYNVQNLFLEQIVNESILGNNKEDSIIFEAFESYYFESQNLGILLLYSLASRDSGLNCAWL